MISALRDMLGHDFMAHAYLAGTFVALAAGLAGYFVVLRNEVFAADSLGHVAFTGALAALVVGLDPLIGLFATITLVAVGMGALGARVRTRDVVVGTVFAWVLGLGVLFLTLYTTARSAGNGAVGVSILFGSIYGMSLSQAVAAAAVSATMMLLLVVMGRPLMFASLDPDVAGARGLPVRSLGIALMVVVGITVGEAVQAVGALLIFGLMVTPAACAQRLTSRPFLALGLSAAISLASLWAGLWLSYSTRRLPPSFLVVAIAFGCYVGAVVSTGLRRRWGRRGGRSAPVTPGMIGT